ncbi:MAG: xylulokinase [Candidatus Dormibacteraceae bacterium]
MTFLIGLDVGTTGARALAIEPSGAVAASATETYPLSTPRPGWVEQDPDDWWRASRTALTRVSEAVGPGVAAIGLTGQMHGSVFLDERDEVIRPALLWNDQRTDPQCGEITERVGEDLIRIAGNPALTGFQAPKILWLRENEPHLYRRLRHVLLPKDYVRYRLTGEFATDVSDASGTLLLDMRARDWSRELLDRLEIPRDWLPPVRESAERAGQVTAQIASDLGLGAGLPVAAGAGDNASAAVGVGAIHSQVAMSSIGTSGVIFAPTETFSPDSLGRVHAFCHAVPGGYHLMGVTLAAGGSLRWWRDECGGGEDYEDLAALAATAPPGAEGLIYLPHLFGERSPHLDPRARGAFVGLTGRHHRAHLTRAVMEGVLFSLRQPLDIIAVAGQPAEMRATGGGSRSDLWLQLQADIYGLPIEVTAVDEGAAYGAALLAGVAAGIFTDTRDACRVVRVRDTIGPDHHRTEIYDELFGIFTGLYPALRGTMHALGAFVDVTSGHGEPAQLRQPGG